MTTFNQLWQLSLFRKWLVLANSLFAQLLFYLIPLLPGLVIGSFFDRLSGAQAAGINLWTIAALLVVIEIGRITILLIGNVTNMTLRVELSTLLRVNIFRRLLGRPDKHSLPASSGEAIGRLRNDAGTVGGFISSVAEPVALLVVFGVAFWILSTISALVTLVVFVPLLATVMLVNAAGKRIQRYRVANQAAVANVTSWLGEIFRTVQAFQVAGAEERAIHQLKTLNETRRRAMLADLLLSRSLRSVSSNAADLGTGVILLLIAESMRDGTFTIGDFAIYVSYLTWLTKITPSLGSYLTDYKQVGVSLSRLGAFLTTDGNTSQAEKLLVEHHPIYPHRNDTIGSDLIAGRTADLGTNGAKLSHYALPKMSVEPLRKLDVVGLTYTPVRQDKDTPNEFERNPSTPELVQNQASLQGIRDISFSLERGSFTVITGRIGAGKSLLLRVLLGLLPKDAGEIRWNGTVVEEPTTLFTPPQVAYTPQVPQLFSETLQENLLLGLSVDQTELEHAIHSAVFEEDIATLDSGLETLIGPRGVRLSGGQVQRAAAARMFVRKPELFVIDDLSSALDVETEEKLWNRLGHQTDLTCLAVSHRRTPLARADQIIVLENGAMTRQGTLEELLETCVEMQELWRYMG